jgi:hypothetical protein
MVISALLEKGLFAGTLGNADVTFCTTPLHAGHGLTVTTHRAATFVGGRSYTYRMTNSVDDIKQLVALLRRLNESGTLAWDSEGDLTFHVTQEEYDLLDGTSEHIEPDDADQPGMRWKWAYGAGELFAVSIVSGDPSLVTMNANGD